MTRLTKHDTLNARPLATWVAVRSLAVYSTNMLEAGRDPSHRDSSVITRAVEFGSSEIVT